MQRVDTILNGHQYSSQAWHGNVIPAKAGIQKKGTGFPGQAGE
jgi:hypothetical protein